MSVHWRDTMWYDWEDFCCPQVCVCPCMEQSNDQPQGGPCQPQLTALQARFLVTNSQLHCFSDDHYGTWLQVMQHGDWTWEGSIFVFNRVIIQITFEFLSRCMPAKRPAILWFVHILQMNNKSFPVLEKHSSHRPFNTAKINMQNAPEFLLSAAVQTTGFWSDFVQQDTG